ncbi:MAG TPA: hypothetical protein VGG45_06975 [Terracidiphilus sp.]|jgi:hypothetical protein
MKHGLILACITLGFGSNLYAQATTPVDVKVCDVVKKPQAFNGQIVRVKGTVVAGFDEFVIKDSIDPNCGFLVNAIWLDYPQGTKGKAGPAALVTIQPAKNFAANLTPATRAAVTLGKSKDFKQFDSLLAQKHEKGADLCLGCTRYEVTATLVGRLDTVADATLKRDDKGKIVGFGGFGNMNAYPARLVLESVSDVTPKEVDYSKNDDETKGGSSGGYGAGPYGAGAGNGMDLPGAVAAAKAIADKLAAGPPKDEAEKAAAIYGKAGDHSTGVYFAYGAGNEASPEESGTKDSPDGILFNCTFNSDRLQGDSLARAVIHIGEHVSELRNPKPGNEAAPPYLLESDAWVVTAISAVAGGQKYLSAPGGYVLWDSNWSAADRNDDMANAIKAYLANEAMLGQ